MKLSEQEERNSKVELRIRAEIEQVRRRSIISAHDPLQYLSASPRTD